MFSIRPASFGFALLLTVAGTAGAQEPDEVLTEHGCLACHSTDGSAGPGPTFQGLFGRSTTVVSDGETRTVEVDEDYVARSIREPEHDVVVGFTAMPDLAVTDADVDAMVDALRELPEEEERPRTIVPLALAALGFAFLHLLLSWHPIRSRLRERLGSKWFQVSYSIAVGIPFGLFFLGWWLRPFVPLFELGDWTRWIPLFVMPFAFVFMVAGYSTLRRPVIRLAMRNDRPATSPQS